jgi:hypothetical protein
MKQIRVGDVLRSRGGLLRIVRAVEHRGTKTVVTFSIKHCSWTGRCYTVYFHNDLKSMGYEPTGKRVRLRSQLDKLVRDEIVNHYRPGDIRVKCCDVEGIA